MVKIAFAKPSEDQIEEAAAIAASMGTTPYWVGDLLCIGEDDPDPHPTVDDVIAERARRLALGFDYDFGDDRGVHRIGTTPQDMAGWDVVTKNAQAALHLNKPDKPIYIVTDTGPAVVTAHEWQEVLDAGGDWGQPIYAASFALQAMNPIPADYADDAYWQEAPDAEA